MNKLKYVKSKLQEWNKSVFKNIFSEKDRLESKLSLLTRKIMSSGMSQEEYRKEKELMAEYEVLAREEVY